MKMETLKQQILTAKGDVRAELVLKNARVINVFTNEIEQADVAIRQGVILGVGHYTGETELDLQGKYVCPGLVDGHIHIESSMLCGPAFEQAVLPHGTTAVVTDPHEISNVAGTAGLDFMLETTKDLALSVYFMLPSCVPATGLDESGAVLEAEQLRPYYQQPRVLGLAELMNSYGTVRADEKILQKICDCTAAGKKIDGHAPFLSGEELNAYIAAGVQSDHECSDIHEAMEKLRRGQYIMVREGTAAQNMESLLPLIEENGEVVGKLTIPGVLEEVVVQRNNTYYLTHNYRGGSSDAGAVFVDESCSFRSPPENLLLRGQAAIEGKVFAPLWQYATGGRDFVASATTAHLTTLYEEADYVLFAVIVASSNPSSPDYFNYAGYPSFVTDADMLSYIEAAREQSLYSFNVDVTASDRLLTLATLGSSTESLVLLFRQMR